MCDCYSHPCKVCNRLLPVHLGDWETGREEIEVFCRKHIPKRDPDTRVWDLTSRHEKEEAGTTRMAIKALTNNARDHWDINYPNAAYKPLPNKKGV